MVVISLLMRSPALLLQFQYDKDLLLYYAQVQAVGSKQIVRQTFANVCERTL